MSSKNSAEINVGFPIYGLRFINSKTLLAVGGGGEGNNGIPNKITAIKCHFNATDKDRRLQKFREITLPSNEDSPMCAAVAHVSGDEHVRYSIFVGCNQSTQLVKSMSINNNLRKYLFTDEEHLRFLDAVQYDNNVLPESIGEYPKIIHLTPENSVGALMTSKVPSEIFIFNPESLALILHFKPVVSGEVKDFHLSFLDEGKTLVYVTASVIEAINSSTGAIVSTSTKAPKATISKLAKYFLSKVRFVAESKVVVTAALRSGKGAAIFEYDLVKQKISNERVISLSMKGVVAIDISSTTGVIACAGNDFSVTLIRTSDLKVIKRFPNLHKFAITSLSFAPNGKRLATGSASNTLNVVNIPAKIGGSSFIGSLFQYLFLIVLVAALAIFVQNARESGDLNQYIALSKKYGGEAFTHAQYYGQHYGKIGLALSKKYGEEYFHKAQHYGKIGYEILKDKSVEGWEVLMDKLNKEEPTQSWVDEVETHTEIASTFDDIVSEVTGDVFHLTAGRENEDLDTASIINAAVSRAVVSSYGSLAETDAANVEETYVPITESSIQDLPLGIAAEIEETPLENVNNVVESIAEKIASAAAPVAESLNEILKPSSEPREFSVHSSESQVETVESAETVESSATSKVEDIISPKEPTSETPNSVEKSEAGTVNEATAEEEAVDEMVDEVASADPIKSTTLDDEPTTEPREAEAEHVAPETFEDFKSVQSEYPEAAEEEQSVEPVAEHQADEVADLPGAEHRKETVDTEEQQGVNSAEPIRVVEEIQKVITKPLNDSGIGKLATKPEDIVELQVVDPETEARNEPKVDPISISDAQPVEPVNDLVIEPAVDHEVIDTKDVVEPASEPLAEPIAKPIAEPIAEPISEPIAEPIAESDAKAAPVAEPVPTPEPVSPEVVEPVAKPVTQSNHNSQISAASVTYNAPVDEKPKARAKTIIGMPESNFKPSDILNAQPVRHAEDAVIQQVVEPKVVPAEQEIDEIVEEPQQALFTLGPASHDEL